MPNPDLFSQLPPNPERIVVYRLDALGDIVLGTLLLSGLRQRWPAARITLVVRPQFPNIAGILPSPLQVLPLPFDPRQPVAGNESQLADFLRDFAQAVPSDLAIISEYNRTWAGEILAEMTAPVTLAFDGPTGLNRSHEAIVQSLGVSPCRHLQLVHTDEWCWEPLKYRDFAAALGIDDSPLFPRVVADTAARDRAGQLLREHGLSPESAVIIFPGSGDGDSRSLPPQTWAAWIAHLRDRGLSLLLLGSEADDALLDAIKPCLCAEIPELRLASKDLAGLAGLLAVCKGYIGMDTGPMHVAAALDKPTLGVFGGGHGSRFLPAGRHAAAIRMPIGCFGCEWICPFDRRLCIQQIPTADLIRAGDDFLQQFLTAPAPAAHDAEPVVWAIAPPPLLAGPDLGAIMRMHRRQLIFNHTRMEYDAYVHSVLSGLDKRLDAIDARLAEHAAVFAEMTRRNEA